MKNGHNFPHKIFLVYFVTAMEALWIYFENLWIDYLWNLDKKDTVDVQPVVR